ncbi:hypothetical protein BPAE_0911g00010 [Botrytis paeoniae]|uniref:Core Histone H2A/H2B/H3 domain-containing protein n=1 Tax=Botrytis paeoniae TaxID=278948 RepID=A0A4Z1ERM6_9HELO|nr:hypothetical protein BPAE_0911g00010 [Botrytis paeoniae]
MSDSNDSSLLQRYQPSTHSQKSVIVSSKKLKQIKTSKKIKIPIFKYKPKTLEADGRRVRDLKHLAREIKFYTNTWTNLIPPSAFARLVRQVAQNIKADLRFQASAIEALQEAAEMMLTIRFDILQDIARHAKRTTIMGRDAGLLQRTLKKAVGIDDVGLAPSQKGFYGYKY